MSYFILMGRRIPKQAITGFKFQNETDNIRPFLSIRIRGKDEIIPFKDKKEIQSVKAHLCSIFEETEVFIRKKFDMSIPVPIPDELK